MKPNGNIVYNNGDEIRELDLLSNIVWRYPGCIDHAFEVLENRRIILERRENLDGNPRFTGEDGLPAWHSCIEIIDTKENKILWDWHSKNHIEDLEELLGVKIFPIGD
ncbi:hypothetical protein J7K25_02825 [bacterium]|nr:hypothetical protein [bacterium]